MTGAVLAAGGAGCSNSQVFWPTGSVSRTSLLSYVMCYDSFLVFLFIVLMKQRVIFFQQTTLTMRETTGGGAASVGPTESLKLEDILEMCADYERQIEAEQKQGLLMRRQMEQQRQQNMMAPSPPQISHLRLPGFNTASPTALALPHVLSPSSPLVNNQQSWSPNTTTASTPNR